jgi:hypothetical protein
VLSPQDQPHPPAVAGLCYMDIRASHTAFSRALVVRTGKSPRRKPVSSAPPRRPAPAPPAPPTNAYVPVWRALPKPLPRGWKDYNQLARESVVPGKAGEAKGQGAAKGGAKGSLGGPKRRGQLSSVHASQYDDWGFIRSPQPNTFSYDYVQREGEPPSEDGCRMRFGADRDEHDSTPSDSPLRVDDQCSRNRGASPAVSSLSVPRGRPLAGASPDGPAHSSLTVSDPSPASSSGDSSREMRVIVKMLRELLVQKRRTIDLLMESSSARQPMAVGPHS